MSDEAFVQDYLDHVMSVMRADDLHEWLGAAVDVLEATKASGNKLIFAGNGASASIASHFALDFTKQAGIRSVSFNDAPLVTAYGNDYGYEHWVARAIEHQGQKGDVAVLISTSGTSPNMVKAADYCRGHEITVITYTGFDPGNPLRERGDVNFWAPSRAYNVVESVHTVWLGLLCDWIIGEREYGVKG